jgi:hypothetical protein
MAALVESHLWLTEWRRLPELVARRQRLVSTLEAHSTAGAAAVGRLRQQVADLDTQIDSRRPRACQLLIVDEASLAGTVALDELVSAANGTGAKVLLVGDPAQLSSVETGAILSPTSTMSDVSPTTGRRRPAWTYDSADPRRSRPIRPTAASPAGAASSFSKPSTRHGRQTLRPAAPAS